MTIFLILLTVGVLWLLRSIANVFVGILPPVKRKPAKKK